jgi:uncharacterized protein YkwD
VERRVPASWWKRLESYKAAACTPAANPPSPDPGTEQPGETLVAVVKLDAREAALRDAVNAERARNGLAPLGLNAGLERAARGHIADIVRFRYFGHDWHDRTPFGKWIGRYSRCVTTGEILAWRTPQQTADNAVQQWLASPPHRVALLSPAWSVMGVELARQYAAVEFGSRC